MEDRTDQPASVKTTADTHGAPAASISLPSPSTGEKQGFSSDFGPRYLQTSLKTYLHVFNLTRGRELMWKSSQRPEGHVKPEEENTNRSK